MCIAFDAEKVESCEVCGIDLTLIIDDLRR